MTVTPNSKVRALRGSAKTAMETQLLAPSNADRHQQKEWPKPRRSTEQTDKETAARGGRRIMSAVVNYPGNQDAIFENRIFSKNGTVQRQQKLPSSSISGPRSDHSYNSALGLIVRVHIFLAIQSLLLERHPLLFNRPSKNPRTLFLTIAGPFGFEQSTGKGLDAQGEHVLVILRIYLQGDFFEDGFDDEHQQVW
mmetsp:Transcript_88036/g.183992  ORF Transcript_88036/g.183992 Transcript_88036/m.183992 type:complete len:195 (+) Transcript_88036:150-734(+)